MGAGGGRRGERGGVVWGARADGGDRRSGSRRRSWNRRVRLVLIGLVAGFFGALFGVGGGIVIVPVLLLVAQWDLRAAAAARQGGSCRGWSAGGVWGALLEG